MDQNQCGNCGKPTLSKLCSRCNGFIESNEADSGGTNSGIENNEQDGRTIRYNEKIESIDVTSNNTIISDSIINDSTKIKRDEKTKIEETRNKKVDPVKKLETLNKEEKQQTATVIKRSRAPYIILALSILLSVFALSQLNYTEMQDNIMKMFIKNPTTIEEEIIINAQAPYNIKTISQNETSNKNQNMEEKILAIQCGDRYKPIIPLSTVEGAKHGQTILLGMQSDEIICENSEYYLYDANEKIKSLPIKINSDIFELYIINIPIDGFTLNPQILGKTQIKNKEKMYLNNNTENSFEKVRILENSARGGSYLTINSKTGEVVEIMVEGIQVTKDKLCGNLVVCY